MKNSLCVILLFLGVSILASAEGIAEKARKGNEMSDISYAFGMLVAEDLRDTGLEFNYNSFSLGFREAMEGEETRFTLNEAIDRIETAFSAFQAEKSRQNLEEGKAFLAENEKRPEVTVTPSGLQVEIISEGDGEMPGPADTVLVHYRGTIIDGTVFDSSYDFGEPLEIPLYRVIPGWSEGLRMMKEGSKARLYIPPNLAYGENGAGGLIGPNATLIFDVELLSIVRPEIQSKSNEEDIPDIIDIQDLADIFDIHDFLDVNNTPEN